MKAVILAAGIASRLRPLTDNTPKCLLRVGEKNILSLTIDNILANDITDIVFDKNIIKKLISSPYENCLALKRHEVGEEEIKVKVDSQNRILEISKEVKPNEALGESIGIEKFAAEGVSKLFEILEQKVV